MDYSGLRIGPQTLADGTAQSFPRGTKEGAAVGANLGGVYEEATIRGQVFSLVLPATSTGIAAGHQSGAAAGANLQFGVFNPTLSGKNIVLLECAIGDRKSVV